MHIFMTGLKVDYASIQCKIEFDIPLYCAKLLWKAMLMTQQIHPGFIHY
jgi:hypothetical protein